MISNHEEAIREAYASQLRANGEHNIAPIVDKHIIDFKRSEVQAYRAETGTVGTVPIKELAKYVTRKYAFRDAEPECKDNCCFDLIIRIEGGVSESNFNDYRELWVKQLDSVNLSPETDEEFAEAENFVKQCLAAEKAVKSALEEALDGTVEVSRLVQGVNDLLEKMRETRLAADKAVKKRKEQLRTTIIRDGEKKVADHIRALEGRLPAIVGVLDCSVRTVAEAAKGKRTVHTMRNAVDTEVNRLIVEAEKLVPQLIANIGLIEYCGRKSLFPDLKQLIKRPRQEVEAVINSRIAENELEQERRRQAEIKKQEEEAAVAKPTEEANTVESTKYDLQSFLDDVKKKPDQQAVETWRKKHDKRIKSNLTPDGIDRLDAFCLKLISDFPRKAGLQEETQQKKPAENASTQTEQFIMVVEISGTVVEAQAIARRFHDVIGTNRAVSKVSLRRTEAPG